MGVAPDGAGAVAGQVVQAQGLALQVFLQLVEGQRPVERGQGQRIISLGFIVVRQRRQPAHRQPAQPLALGGHPVLKGRRVGQAEALQEIALVAVEGGCQGGRAGTERSGARAPGFPNARLSTSTSGASASEPSSALTAAPSAWRRPCRVVRRVCWAAGRSRSGQNRPSSWSRLTGS